MKQRVYADNAATTQLDIRAFEAMKPFLLDEFGNSSQPYSFARIPKKAIQEARENIASCIGAEPDEIYFTSGGTESDNWAIKSIFLDATERQEAIVSAFEHHAVLHACDTIMKQGIKVQYVFPNNKGQIIPENLKELLSSRTRIVSIMLANNEIGSIQPIKELCRLSHQHEALFHTDAVQAVGHIDVNVKDLEIDFLSASAHKFNGPKGIGFLYVRRGIEIPAFMDGGAQENGRRAGTENVASIIGMATALKLNCDSIKRNRAHLLELEHCLLRKLNETGLDYIRNGGTNTLPGLISLSFKDTDGEAILHRMDLMGISISTGSACNGNNTEISHVLNAIGLDKQYALGTIRISLGKTNTKEDVEAIVEGLRKIIVG